MTKPLFQLGQIAATPGALEAIQASGDASEVFLFRHMTGDWGDLHDEDKAKNEYSLDGHLRQMSAYPLANGQRLWVRIQVDRSTTTLVLPEEY